MSNYFKVKAGFAVWERTGESRSTGMYSQPVYREIKAKRGEEIHFLPGGTFLVKKDGQASMIRITNVTPYVGQKACYGVKKDVWPMEKMTRLTAEKSFKVISYNR